AAVRLTDVAEVTDSVQDNRNLGMSEGQPSVLVILYRQPNANIIETVDAVKAELPHLEAAMPADMNVNVAIDRSTTIRASLRDTELTLVLAVMLVTVVVFLFLRNISATIIPSVAVPISIFGTFGVMYLLGYSLDILSLMALTIATGFVVDDAIVVMENIARHMEEGMPRLQAAFRGAREVGFTVLSISLSLIMVFLPILLMGGILGRLFREFTVTLSIAILVSLVISLTTTPMLCALFLKTDQARGPEGRPSLFERVRIGYGHTLTWALRHSLLVLAIFIATVGLNVYLFYAAPRGFFPQQDTGRIIGSLQADQSISFQSMSVKLKQMIDIVRADPAVDTVVGFTGVGSGGGFSQINTGTVFVSLKPISQRVTVDEVLARLRPKLAQVPGGRLYLAAVQDLRAGGRQSNAQYQYTLQSENAQDLYTWTPKLVDALEHNPVLTDVSSDQQQRGLETYLTIDRDTTARLGVSPLQIDNTLYDAFGQRQVSTIYNPLNQYHVVMEVAPRYWESPEILREVYVSTAAGGVRGAQSTNAVAGTVSSASVTASAVAADTARNQAANQLANTGRGNTSTGAAVATAAETMVPLVAFSSFGPDTTPLAVNHQGHFVASTISFNLAPDKSLSDAARAIAETMARLGVPGSIHGSFQGTARVFQQSLSNELVLILAALVAMYVVLGMLYESYVHPITILSTLPSAGVGALLALMMFRIEFSLMAMIGVLLLIGLVKKNAIMMIDFAIDAERREGRAPAEAIYQACLLRFRPIMMTTMAALLGAVSPALGIGEGAELRQPLGISIVGGLILSQILTLYTTPVIYLYLDRFRLWWRDRVTRRAAALEGARP
ncbi:MAG TPA: efflux RND transporter permease subunit, partial [Methylomirabilota bacterium]|nr:efflux RND transporter permease subunit [Methylomirabilota bacterium]